ncbi:MAG: phage terminase large subunit [Pseudomonadota bacterium]
MAVAKPKVRYSRATYDDFLVEVSLLAEAMRADIASSSELDGFDRTEAGRRERVARSERDFGFFCQTYFPHFGRAEYSAFHQWIFSELPLVIASQDGQREAIAAPRGNAKSTYITQLLTLWAVMFRKRRYPVILSDAIEVAAMMLEGIKAELEANPRLAFDYPDLVGEGPVWQIGTIVTRNGAKIQAAGAGKRIRGARHGAQRPDLVIFDDIENDDNVKSPEQRDKREDWIDKAIEPLGPPDGSMHIIYVGTVLAPDAVLARKLKHPMWRATKFKAVIGYPDRMDLWDQWEETLRNDGREAAEAFYRTNHADMEAGAVVLWPAVQPFKRLMEIRLRIGRKAFNSEYQNTPMAEDAVFGRFVYWVQQVPRWIFVGALDPSLGKNNKARDPSAILIGGFDREEGRLDVVEASIRRRLPNVIISDAVALQRQYRCLMWFVESVQFQEFLRTQLMKEAVRQGVPFPARAVIPHADKVLRIESLQPPMDDGLIRLHASQTTLIEQLEGFPEADHDDGPDCLEMLWTGAVTFARAGAGRIRTGGSRVVNHRNLSGFM